MKRRPGSRLEYRSVLRTFHLGVVASLLLASTQAPFSHTHESDPHHEHARGFVHAHWKDHVPSGPAWEADDHDSDARSLNWFAGDGKSPIKVEAAMPAVVVLPTPSAQTSLIAEPTPHNHDPPWQSNLKSRAPPV